MIECAARRAGFFFQAEDGIRDFHVTGVQTCALPIWPMVPNLWTSVALMMQYTYFPRPPMIRAARSSVAGARPARDSARARPLAGRASDRSEERRVGKASTARPTPHGADKHD